MVVGGVRGLLVGSLEPRGLLMIVVVVVVMGDAGHLLVVVVEPR